MNINTNSTIAMFSKNEIIVISVGCLNINNKINNIVVSMPFIITGLSISKSTKPFISIKITLVIESPNQML
ncbi:MAG: hypothetical protein ACI4TX_02800, partial [Christensenellales bacterium]